MQNEYQILQSAFLGRIEYPSHLKPADPGHVERLETAERAYTTFEICEGNFPNLAYAPWGICRVSRIQQTSPAHGYSIETAVVLDADLGQRGQRAFARAEATGAE